MRTGRMLAALAVTLVMGAFGALPASGQSASPAAPASSASQTTFKVGTLQPLKTINPLRAINGTEYEFLFLNYDLPIPFGVSNLAPSPGIVTNWTRSSDGLTWTYTLRSGVTWQDGVPLTAHDVAFTLNFLSKYKNSVASNFATYVPHTASITAPNDTTVVWKTTQPINAPQFPPWLYVLPEHIWGKMSPQDAHNFEKVPVVGSGPFELVKWDTKAQSWEFKANDSYWGGAPHIQTLIFQQFDNAEAMVQALKAGDIDFADSVPVDLFRTLQHAPGITTNVAAPTTFDQLSFGQVPFGHTPTNCTACDTKHASTTNPILEDPQVRLAMEYAIDKQALVDKVLGGYGVPGTTVVPAGFTNWHWSPPASEQINFDIAKANQILDQAGYTKGTNGGTWSPSCNCTRVDPKTGQPFKFRFYVLTSEPNEVKDAQYIQGWWKQIGVQVSPQAVSEGKLVDIWYSNDYDIYMWGWGPDPDPDFILSTFTSQSCGVWSDTCFSNPQYDKLYQQQAVAPDPTARKQIVTQMQQFIYQQVPEVVLYYNEDTQAYASNQWTGFINQPQPTGFKLFAYGPYSYLSIRPKAGAVITTGSGGISGFVWLAIAAGLVVVIGGIVLARRRGEEDRA